jgi:hypothetical protein
VTRVTAHSIVVLTLFFQVACTKTDGPIRTNDAASAIDSASNMLSPLEPSIPAGAPGSIESVGSCNIDVVNDQPPTEKPFALPSNSPLRLEGWVVDESNPKRVPDQLFILLQAVDSGSRWNAKVLARVPRADVVKAKGSSLLSGFRTRFDVSKVPRGEYHVQVAFWRNGPLQVCDAGRRVLIE